MKKNHILLEVDVGNIDKSFKRLMKRKYIYMKKVNLMDLKTKDIEVSFIITKINRKKK